MDREILFRGKRTDSGEWVEGYYTKQCDCCGAVHMILHCAQDPDDDNRAYYIIPETVGQYTGLTDKNGTKIFEGDILSTGNFDEYFGVVEWIEENSGLAVSFNCLAETFEELILFDKVELEIIGNIYDNSELLEISE